MASHSSTATSLRYPSSSAQHCPLFFITQLHPDSTKHTQKPLLPSPISGRNPLFQTPNIRPLGPSILSPQPHTGQPAAPDSGSFQNHNHLQLDGHPTFSMHSRKRKFSVPIAPPSIPLHPSAIPWPLAISPWLPLPTHFQPCAPISPSLRQQILSGT